MPQTLTADTVERVIPAPPEVLYDIIADVTRMPELSPEIRSCTWVGGATGPAVGARFRAINKIDWMTWPNWPVVITATRGREFAVSRTEPFFGTLEWRYRFETEGPHTRVIESYTVTRPLTRFAWFLLERVKGITDRAADIRSGMLITLDRLAETAARGQLQHD